MTLRKCLMSLSVALILPLVANAAFSVSAPTATVSTGVVNVPISVSGGDNIDASSIAFIVRSVAGNSGTGKLLDFTAPSSSTIWTMSQVSTATLDLSSSNPTIDLSGTSRSIASISNGGGSVAANGVVGYVQLDLSAAAPGDMFLIDFADSPLTKASLGNNVLAAGSLTSGKLTAVPEPSAFALVGIVGIGVAGNWYRKRRLAKAAAAAE